MEENEPTPRPRHKPYHNGLIRAHVEHVTVDAIASATGLSRSTVQRWRRERSNMLEVEAARSDVVATALARLRLGLGDAAERLVTIAKAGEGSTVAVAAARAVFECHRQLTEATTVQERLAALEAVLAGHQAVPFQRHRPTVLSGGLAS